MQQASDLLGVYAVVLLYLWGMMNFGHISYNNNIKELVTEDTCCAVDGVWMCGWSTRGPSKKKMREYKMQEVQGYE